jgi:hypothetical protein
MEIVFSTETLMPTSQQGATTQKVNIGIFTAV